MPFRIELSDPVGNALDTITNFTALDCAVAFNTVGHLSFTIPELYDLRDFRMDMRLRLYIDSPHLSTSHLFGETVFFLHSVERKDDTLVFDAADANSILANALVAYTGETTFADKTEREWDIAGLYSQDPYLRIDNMMRAFVAENIAAEALDATRRNPFIDVEDFRSLAPLGEKEAAFAYLLPTLQDLARQSEDKGVPLYFNLWPKGEDSFIFRVWSNQPRVDRSSTSLSPTVLLEENGDLVDVSEKYDWSESANVGYGLGLGSGNSRVVVTEKNDALLRTGPFSRREFTVDMSDADDLSWMSNEVRAALQGRRPRVRVSAKVGDDSQQSYGRDFAYGDKIVVVAGRRFYRQYDCYISAVQASMQSGRESITLALTGVDYL